MHLILGTNKKQGCKDKQHRFVLELKYILDRVQLFWYLSINTPKISLSNIKLKLFHNNTLLNLKSLSLKNKLRNINLRKSLWPSNQKGCSRSYRHKKKSTTARQRKVRANVKWGSQAKGEPYLSITILSRSVQLHTLPLLSTMCIPTIRHERRIANIKKYFGTKILCQKLFENIFLC